MIIKLPFPRHRSRFGVIFISFPALRFWPFKWMNSLSLSLCRIDSIGQLVRLAKVEAKWCLPKVKKPWLGVGKRVKVWPVERLFIHHFHLHRWGPVTTTSGPSCVCASVINESAIGDLFLEYFENKQKNKRKLKCQSRTNCARMVWGVFFLADVPHAQTTHTYESRCCFRRERERGIGMRKVHPCVHERSALRKWCPIAKNLFRFFPLLEERHVSHKFVIVRVQCVYQFDFVPKKYDVKLW